MNITETARKALEVLDKDGWNKGYLTKIALVRANDPYRIGSHCTGGAWMKAQGMNLRGATLTDGNPGPLIQMIREQYPEIDELIEEEGLFHDLTPCIRVITKFNDLPSTTEADVRAILEKLAAKEG